MTELPENLKNVGDALDNERVSMGISATGAVAKQSEAPEQAEEPVSEPVETPKEEPKMDDSTANELKERVEKMENVLQEFGKFFMEYKEENAKRVGELSEAVSAFRNEMLNIKTAAQKTEAAPAAPAPVQSAESTPAEKPNHKTGDTKSSDVDINEIFSNANGRMMKK